MTAGAHYRIHVTVSASDLRALLADYGIREVSVRLCGAELGSGVAHLCTVAEGGRRPERGRPGR